MADKVTTMVLNVVDLQCSKCYKKIKKVLCKFPEIRDQKYDEKANKVTITVVSCSPEKIRDKLCCKGGGCIKSIEIVKPPEKKKPEPVKVSVDLQVQGFFYCKFCGGRPRGPCSCGGQGLCVQCKRCRECSSGPCSCGGQGQCVQCKQCSGWPSGPCSCGGRGRCDPCCGKPVCDSWCRYGSSCEETQPGCTIM